MGKFKGLDEMIKSTRKSRIKWLLSELKLMKMCIRVLCWIREPPVNEEEKEELKCYVQAYDDAVKRIESDFLCRIREYL